MDITIKIPDQIWKEDSVYKEYFEKIQQMVNRMAMSHYKYGPLERGLEYIDEMDSGRKRLFMYDGVGGPFEDVKGNTGNTENLIDAANFFIIESLFPKHKFKAQTSAESPGLTYKE